MFNSRHCLMSLSPTYVVVCLLHCVGVGVALSLAVGEELVVAVGDVVVVVGVVVVMGVVVTVVC